MKKGVYFTLDALFAAILIGLALILSVKYMVSDNSQSQINYYSEDIVASMSSIKITEINDTFIKSLIAAGNISNLDNSVIEQIGEFYVLNQTELARNLSMVITQKLLPRKFGLQVLVNGESLYINSSQSGANTQLVSSRRLISGYEKFKPLKGATSKVFLQEIKTHFPNYLYFGGFIGQGNITATMTGVPSDAIITDMALEAEAGGNFELYFNGAKCGSTFTPSGVSMKADRWDITSCNNLINKGSDNEIKIIFRTLLNQSYIAGGFLKVEYETQEVSGYFEGYKIKYRFPGIDGVANLYDSFYVPGSVEDMNLHLHFYANDTSYLTVGGRIIHYWNGSLSEQTYDISDADLATPAYSSLSTDYPMFSNNTVPIRFASYETVKMVLIGGNADIILITDLSGSMKKATEDWSQGHTAGSLNTLADCRSKVYVDPAIRKTDAAICSDLELTNITMNYTGNRVWPVSIVKSGANEVIWPYTGDPNSRSLVESEIKGYNQGSGKTCISCAINMAYDMLGLYSNNNRSKFVVLMTDGVPTSCPTDGCFGNATTINQTPVCSGLCDVSGNNCGNITASCVDCTNKNAPSDSAIYAAQRLKDKYNATIFTVGFGPIDDCAQASYVLSRIANISNGTYQFSKNVSMLRGIYQNISVEILEQIEQVSQTVVVQGNVTKSILYPDSYIEVNYKPIANDIAFDEIAVAIEEPKFTSCSPSFNIPEGMRVLDAKITSYSGIHWTDLVSINSKEIYNLDNFLLSYARLGDPFFVYVPVNNIVNGTNTLFIETGDTPVNKTNCSISNNTIIYTGVIKSSISYADVLPNSEGCRWTLEFDDGDTAVIDVPEDYTGTKTCRYTSTNISYDVNDSIDSAAFQLFSNLDYDGDQRIFINIDQLNLKVNAISVEKIPYPWGPAIAEVRVWR